MNFNNETSPQDLNKKLIKKYKYGLMDVAYVIAEILLEDFSFEGYSIHRIKISEAIKTLEKIKEDFIGMLRRYYSGCDLFGEYVKFDDLIKRDNFIKSEFKSTFEQIESMINMWKYFQDNDSPKFSWRPKTKKHIIASTFMMERQHIVKILRWFYSRLQGAEYRDILKTKQKIDEEINLLNRAQKRIGKSNTEKIVILRCLFFPEMTGSTSRVVDQVKSIEFGKDSVTVKTISEDKKFEIVRCIQFGKYKPVFSSTKIEIKEQETQVPRYLIFPNKYKYKFGLIST